MDMTSSFPEGSVEQRAYDQAYRHGFLLGHWVRAQFDKEIVQEQLTSILEEYNRMEETNSQDPLTGLLNRRGLEAAYETLSTARWQRKADTSLPMSSSLLFIDLDRFKDINDNYGHAFGDSVLIEIADILKTRLRVNDIIGRPGGDEFVVLLPQTAKTAAAKVAEELREAVESIGTTLSVGVDEIEPGLDFSAAAFKADQAMYKAKRLGRNQVQVASSESD